MYIVAGISFYLSGLEGSLGRNWDQFVRYDNDERKVTFEISLVHSIERCTGINYFYVGDGYPYAIKIYNNVLLASKDWKRAIIFELYNANAIERFIFQIFYTHAVRRQMLQLHCATIDDGGRGILFLGPSGIGKTTQAERWAQYRASAIINGDIGFVQRTPAGYTAWGTPWHGSSPYCLNASVPVKALVVLKQAPQNALRELTGFEKVREVSGSVFYPTWLEDGMELCTDTLNHLLSDLPVYRLDNRADEEAVRLLAAEIDSIS